MNKITLLNCLKNMPEYEYVVIKIGGITIIEGYVWEVLESNTIILTSEIKLFRSFINERENRVSSIVIEMKEED